MAAWLRVALTISLASTVLAGSASARDARTPTLWWNDPVIVEQITLTDAQRQKMDASWGAYEKKVAPVRDARANQREFVEALEKGDYERARKLLSQWVDADQTPRRAMAELKLDILPQLTADQRSKLLESYPRLIRRNWAPSIVWGPAPPTPVVPDAPKGPKPMGAKPRPKGTPKKP